MYMYNYVIKSELRIKYPYVLFCVGFDTLHYEFGSNVSTCEYYEGGYVQGDIYLFISLYLSISPSLYTYLSIYLSLILSHLYVVPCFLFLTIQSFCTLSQKKILRLHVHVHTNLILNE